MTTSGRFNLNRRDFMKTLALLGAAAGAPALLGSCAGSSGGSGGTETWSLQFDHSHLAPLHHDFYLVLGERTLPLTRSTTADIQTFKRSNRFLSVVPDRFITHHLTGLELPADQVQLCTVRQVPRGAPANAPWKIATMFLHIPQKSLANAFHRSLSSTGLHAKAGLYGASFTAISDDDLIAAGSFLGAADTAACIVSLYPEMMSLDPDSAGYVNANIIKAEPHFRALAASIQSQGDSWCTYQPVTDASGTPYLDDDGAIIQVPVYSATTIQKTQPVMTGAMASLRKDATLNANVDKTQNSSDLQGKLGLYQDGITHTDASQQAGKGLGADMDYILTDTCTGPGYKLSPAGSSQSGSYPVVTLDCNNYYVRHMGIYIRYIDGGNNTIPVSALPSDYYFVSHFWSNGDTGRDTSTEKFLDYLDPTHTLLGVPYKPARKTMEIPIPPNVSGFQVISDTFGSYDDQHPKLHSGYILTIVLDLAIPTFFLGLGIGGNFASFMGTKNSSVCKEILEQFGEMCEEAYEGYGWHNQAKIAEFSIRLCGAILALTNKSLLRSLMAKFMTISAVKKMIPYVSQVMTAISIMSTATSLAETAAAVLNSPWSYLNTVLLQHTITVTIYHDPKDTDGFPSTATNYTITALFSRSDSQGVPLPGGGTPYIYNGQMPPTTRTAPIVVTMTVPYNGNIYLTVGFYSATGWLAGSGDNYSNPATRNIDNTKSAFSITIKENLVPLTPTTVYSHKQKITLDAAGNHVWTATTTPPAPAPVTLCGTGDICQVTSITDSNTFASLGYAWQGTGSNGQLQYRFANISTAQSPQDSYIVSNGSVTPIRVVYELDPDINTQHNFYLDASQSGYFIRQIRLALYAKPGFDAPDSNKAFGRFNFPSDAMLLHPNGKIVSINTAMNKIEVLTLPVAPLPDSQAPLAAVYGAQGLREGLLDGPLCAAITAKGQILVLETRNNRIQAFDTGGNPVPMFANNAYYVPLKYAAGDYTYLDMATEFRGYIYLLCYQYQNSVYTFYLDIYDPQGSFVSRTRNFSGVKIAVSYWRDLFAANLETLRFPNGALPTIAEPSISRWIPSTP